MTNQLLAVQTESAGEISAVALLKLMMRAESARVSAGISATPCEREQKAASLPVGDTCDVTFELSPYLQDQLESVAASVFHRDNAEFYSQYRLSSFAGDVTAVGEFALSAEDLRPLAYRALMSSADLAPGFAQSLLTLARYWDCDFMEQYKDVAGRLTRHSARKLLRKF